MNKSSIALVLLMIGFVLGISGCQGEPVPTEIEEVEETPSLAVPYSRGPTSPPSVKGPTAPPGVDTGDVPEAVTEVDPVTITLPEESE
jgi:hypothetical protein